MTEFIDNLIAPENLHDLIKQKYDNVKVLDASFTLPGTSPDAREIYHTKRLPNARFFDIDQACDKNSDLPHMLPDTDTFAQYVGSLGIKNTDKVVLYGQQSVAMGPCRALWMFEIFGHKDVVILNAGLNHWEKLGHQIETGMPESVRRQDYKHYKAEFDDSQLAGLDDVQDALKKKYTILDARPPERFSGQQPEPRENLRAGHMPGAVNLPASQLINPETGGFKNPEEIKDIIDKCLGQNVSDVITTCGSGVTACVLRQGLKLSKFKSLRVYDGSWSQWGQACLSTPVSQTPYS